VAAIVSHNNQTVPRVLNGGYLRMILDFNAHTIEFLVNGDISCDITKMSMAGLDDGHVCYDFSIMTMNKLIQFSSCSTSVELFAPDPSCIIVTTTATTTSPIPPIGGFQVNNDDGKDDSKVTSTPLATVPTLYPAQLSTLKTPGVVDVSSSTSPLPPISSIPTAPTSTVSSTDH
jgi:hypothetical protein